MVNYSNILFCFCACALFFFCSHRIGRACIWTERGKKSSLSADKSAKKRNNCEINNKIYIAIMSVFRVQCVQHSSTSSDRTGVFLPSFQSVLDFECDGVLLMSIKYSSTCFVLFPFLLFIFKFHIAVHIARRKLIAVDFSPFIKLRSI